MTPSMRPLVIVFALGGLLSCPSHAAQDRRSVEDGQDSHTANSAVETGPAAYFLEIHYPPDGALISDTNCGAFIAGRAGAVISRLDIAIVLDTSRSTIHPSGSDIDGDGIVGVRAPETDGSIFDSRSSDPDDSIFAAEVAAARRLVEQLDPKTTRVSLVTFAGDPRLRAGDPPSTARETPARTIQPLTSEFSQIETALERLLLETPRGATHMAAGLDHAIRLLADRATSDPGRNAATERMIFFFTDGQPTLPYGPEREGDNIREVLQAVQRAIRDGVRIHSFAIGADALEGPLAVVEMASLTGGQFVPVQRAGDLATAVADVSVVRLIEVNVRNRTTAKDASLLRTRSDGVWGGFVPLAAGVNEIEIVARTSDGKRTRRLLNLNYERGAEQSEIPVEITAIHESLLADCLDSVKRVRFELEQRILRKLRLEIQRERLRARQRAASQRKRLRISVEE